MKKLLIIAMAIIALSLYSCSKEKLSSIAPTQKVKIFMSSPLKSSQLKSAPALSEDKTEIKDGDTAIIYNARELYIILSAISENGTAADGKWDVSLIEAESDNDSCRLVDRVQTNSNNSLVALMPYELGIYRATFSRLNVTKTTVFIKHMGMPGQIGDDYLHGYAVQIEKKLFFNLAPAYTSEFAYSVFLRCKTSDYFYSDSQNANNINPLLEKYYNAILYFDGKDQNFKVKRCKFSPDYVCFTFFPSEFPPRKDGNYGRYSMLFYSGIYPSIVHKFSAVIESKWNIGGSNEIGFAGF